MQLSYWITEELFEEGVDKVKSQLRDKVILAAGDSLKLELMNLAEGLHQSLRIISKSQDLDTAIIALTAMKLCVIEHADRKPEELP